MLPLPRNWQGHVKSAVVHTISLAFYCLTVARGWAVNSPITRVRLQAENSRLKDELAVKNEALHLLISRLSRIPARRRPHYLPVERMVILELKAAHGLSLIQTAAFFGVCSATVASWMKRLDEQGSDALVRLPAPVNKFPEYVQYLVKRLKALCPTMGKVKLVQILARAGLHLGATTAARCLKDRPRTPKSHARDDATDDKQQEKPVVKADYPNHLWHVDMTTVPTGGGFWVPWLPFSLPQVWPFGWWIVFAVDHYSRRVMGFAVFRKQPTSRDVRAFLGRTMARVKAVPRHLVCDKGTQFDCDGFRKWCQRRIGRQPRYGAVGRQGSVAVVERFIRTQKENYLRRILIPLRLDQMRTKLTLACNWYNQHRPHETLNGATPLEIYESVTPANLQPRYEPRRHWPKTSKCAAPIVPIKGKRGVRLELVVTFMDKERQLPVVELREVA